MEHKMITAGKETSSNDLGKRSHRTGRTHYHWMAAVPALLILMLILAPGSPTGVAPAEATFLLIGGDTCLVAIETLRLARAVEQQVDLARLLGQAERVCEFIRDISPESQLFRLAQPLIRDLVDFVDRGDINTPQGPAQLARILRQIPMSIFG